MSDVKRLCTICARGGSQGLPGKNLRPLLGRPMLAWSIEQARASGLFEHLAVSSDSDEILGVAGDLGVELLVRRPDELATAEAAKLPAIHHAVADVERRVGERFDVLVDLDATSPLRLPEDIVGAVRLLESSGASNVITGCPARRSPYFNLVERDERGVVGLAKPPREPVVRRQDAPPCFDMNASVYVWQRDVFMKDPLLFYPDTLLYEMPEERSIDVDTPVDFELVELLLRRRANA